MALNHSPKIVTDGLVFAYDMGNTNKSNLGEPTTNLAYNNGVAGSQYLAGHSIWINSGTFTLNDNETDISKPIVPNNNVISKDLRIVSGITTSVGSQHVGFAVTTMSPSTTYTISCWFRQNRAGCSAPYFRTNVNNNSLGNFSYNGDTNSSNWPVNQWVRIVATGTVQANENGGYLSNYIGGAVGDKIWYYGYQVEQKSYVTPLVAGTRTNTQAIIDQTGLNTITANSLTYASDGTFSFNGSSNSITVPFNSSQFTFNSAQTIIIWMKNQSPSSARRNPYNQAYAGGGTITHENDTNFNYYFGTGGGDNSPYIGFTSSFSVVVGETAMICLTRDASTVSWYKNGTFSNSISNPYGASVVTGTNNITIGSGYAGAFGGNIYAVQLYNRALSAAEVKQNFNAIRGRYSI